MNLLVISNEETGFDNGSQNYVGYPTIHSLGTSVWGDAVWWAVGPTMELPDL